MAPQLHATSRSIHPCAMTRTVGYVESRVLDSTGGAFKRTSTFKGSDMASTSLLTPRNAMTIHKEAIHTEQCYLLMYVLVISIT